MVVRCGINPVYFLDEMEIDETESILNEYYSMYKEDMEEKRWMGFVIAQNLTGGAYKSLKEFRPFTWDDDDKIETVDNTLDNTLDNLLSILEKI
jgi:hypothetical protein